MDSGLFFIDKKKRSKNVILNAASVQESEASKWHDSDDEGVQVHLDRDPRLKKLRSSEEDNTLKGSGLHYKLRNQ